MSKYAFCFLFCFLFLLIQPPNSIVYASNSKNKSISRQATDTNPPIINQLYDNFTPWKEQKFYLEFKITDLENNLDIDSIKAIYGTFRVRHEKELPFIYDPLTNICSVKVISKEIKSDGSLITIQANDTFDNFAEIVGTFLIIRPGVYMTGYIVIGLLVIFSIECCVYFIYQRRKRKNG